MRLPALLSLLALVLQEAGTAAFPRKERTRREGHAYTVLHLGGYVLSLCGHAEVTDLSDSEELTVSGDQLPKVKKTNLAHPPQDLSHPEHCGTKDTIFSPHSAGPAGFPDQPRGLPLFHLPPGSGLPTCLICVCLGSSVYCNDAGLENILPLPRTTAYLYARFNRISRVQAGDFQGLTKLKKIDLSSNVISSIGDDALSLLPALQELILPENQLAALPVLPRGIEFLDVRLNQLQSSGIQPEAFRALEKLQFLYLADNQLDSIPVPLPLSLHSLHLQNNTIKTMQCDTFCDDGEHRHIQRLLEDVRLDGNPIKLSLFPSTHFCLPRLPTGRCT